MLGHSSDCVGIREFTELLDPQTKTRRCKNHDKTNTIKYYFNYHNIKLPIMHIFLKKLSPPPPPPSQPWSALGTTLACRCFTRKMQICPGLNPNKTHGLYDRHYKMSTHKSSPKYT